MEKTWTLEIFELEFVINSWGSQRVPCTWPPVVCAKPAVSGRRGVVHEPPTAANSSLLEATKSFKFRMKLKTEDMFGRQSKFMSLGVFQLKHPIQ